MPRSPHDTDIDECSEDQDDCDDDNAQCTNTMGSFTCACDSGYFGDGSMCTGECCVMGVVSLNGCGVSREAICLAVISYE